MLHATEHIEVIVVDGGSNDRTVALSEPLADRVVQTTAGRARQMNAGSRVASGDVLLFLHADTTLPTDFFELIAGDFWCSKRGWGRFDVKLSGPATIYRIIESMMNLRSRITGICTGDQAIFVRRELFEETGGFAEIPLMEDIELSKRLKTVTKPFCISSAVVTSSRRWEKQGVARVIVTMWWLRLQYFLGVSAKDLARLYSP